jgi:dTDP-glucose pyrophosphorylase
VNTIILAAGQLNHRLLPMGAHQSNATLPVNGKPVISWLLDDLLDKNIRAATIVFRADNQRLAELLRVCYVHKFDLNLVALEDSESVVASLLSGLAHADAHEPTRVILGDTLVRDDFQNMVGDFVFTSHVGVSDIWCIAELGDNGIVKGYQDKLQLSGTSFNAVVGYYQFSDTGLLLKSTQEARAKGKTQLSEILSEYSLTQHIRAVQVVEWFDFGHIGSFIRSKKSLLRPRHFNQMGIDPLLNTISKESILDEKLRLELAWYDALPAELRVLTPRIVRREERDGRLYFEQEYYGYPTLSELYLYADLDLDAWRNILRYVLDIHQLLAGYAQPAAQEDCRDIYLSKTLERVAQLRAQEGNWAEILQQPHIEWNGKRLANWPLLEAKIIGAAEHLSDCPRFGILHGDFCFSNILYEPASQIVRLIDPRGSFGKPGIYGDPRYDLAKLRHSLAGSYDYIVADLFRVEHEGSVFQTTLFQNPLKAGLTDFFDHEIETLGYRTEEIRLIEALLFFSMLPLHSDHPARQKMMFLRGLQLLNELCD